jgi:hypothetical protein
VTSLITISLCIIFCIVNGEHDARKFARHKTISHFNNGLLYCLFVAAISHVVGWVVTMDAFYVLWLTLAMLAVRPLVFDQYLNVRRGKPFNYQPATPDSFIDRMENALFGRHAWAMSNAVYLALFITGILKYEL